MERIDSSQVTLGSTVHTFVAEASELGWAPGYFPLQIISTDLGNKQPLYRVALNSEYATYHQQAGCIELRVLND